MVERDLAKVDVAGSSPVSRSIGSYLTFLTVCVDYKPQSFWTLVTFPNRRIVPPLDFRAPPRLN